VSQQLNINNELIPRIATPFAGGMGRSGEVCGAVVGGIMSIGIVHGRNDSAQPVDEAMTLTRRFLAEFNQEMGNITCRDLMMDLVRLGSCRV
jgi:C_GCAxxG_C_C family probable redox protein